MRFVVLVALAAAVAGTVSAQVEQQPPEDAAEAAAFAAFLSEIRTAAADRGISGATLDTVLPSIRIHRRAVQADRSQAEFVETGDHEVDRGYRRVGLELDQQRAGPDRPAEKLSIGGIEGHRGTELGAEDQLQPHRFGGEGRSQLPERLTPIIDRGREATGEMRCAGHAGDSGGGERPSHVDRVADDARAIIEAGQEMAVGVDHGRRAIAEA